MRRCLVCAVFALSHRPPDLRSIFDEFDDELDVTDICVLYENDVNVNFCRVTCSRRMMLKVNGKREPIVRTVSPRR